MAVEKLWFNAYFATPVSETRVPDAATPWRLGPRSRARSFSGALGLGVGINNARRSRGGPSERLAWGVRSNRLADQGVRGSLRRTTPPNIRETTASGQLAAKPRRTSGQLLSRRSTTPLLSRSDQTRFSPRRRTPSIANTRYRPAANTPPKLPPAKLRAKT